MKGFYYSLARIATVFRVELENTSREEHQRVLDAENK